MIEQLYINDKDSFLSAVKYCPEKEPTACVLFVHAYSNWKDEHDYMFGRIAEALSHSGIAAMTFDMRGHGESSQKLEEITTQTMREDIASAFGYVTSNICSRAYIVTVGFSARLCLDALGDVPAGYVLLSPAMEIPSSLKVLAEHSGEPFGDVLPILPASDLVVKDLERMGMLPKFVTAELVNADIFSVEEYRGSIDTPTLVISAEDVVSMKDFTHCKAHIIDGGGIMFRSPTVIEKLSEEIVEFINGETITGGTE